MGDPARARASMLWAWGIALYLAVSMAVDIPRLAGLVLLVAWYLHSGSPQIKFVAQNYGSEYERKSWLVPLSIAFAIYGLLVALALVSYALEETAFSK